MNTVHTLLHLSEDRRVITVHFPEEAYVDHPDRFDHYPQVLCRESVTGRSYWEIEWSGDGFVHIAVSYKGISRKGSGNECVFGVSSGIIGVFVDHSAGTLSFYRVDRDTMNLIHKAQTTFTKPLYPGFAVGLGSVKLLKN
ncbi:cytolytic toxin-beta-like [Pimephales promelas]|uniref:cytolytic toxin-beta-like n=1 Tax=Pimephales promelas TaxID=90988 RepID=UPI001955E931|nr:cytolytic toxin-beta-like [Pimephales promelas]